MYSGYVSYQTYNLQKVSHSLGFLFTLLMVFFEAQGFLILMKSDLYIYIFFFSHCALVSYQQIQGHKDSPVYFILKEYS